MVVTLPDHIPALQKMTESELRAELALSLYSARKVTLVQAADIAQKSFFDFQSLLRDRQIPQHYGEPDLDQDLATLRELPPR
jgi:predicted HTH domain antitoxin